MKDSGLVFFCFGVTLGAMLAMTVAERDGSNIKSGTVVYPSEQACIIDTGNECKFNRIGIFIPAGEK